MLDLGSVRRSLPGQHGNGKRISVLSACFGRAVPLLSFASLTFACFARYLPCFALVLIV